ncbi:unnamed protein product, partial [Prorocentrum cordatum]
AAATALSVAKRAHIVAYFRDACLGTKACYIGEACSTEAHFVMKLASSCRCNYFNIQVCFVEACVIIERIFAGASFIVGARFIME